MGLRKGGVTLHIKSSESESRSVVSNSLRLYGLYSPWNSPGRILERVAIPFSRGSSQPRDQTQVSHIACGLFNSWATREVKNLVCVPQMLFYFLFFFFICSGFCHTLQMLFSFRWSSWLSRVDSFIHPSIHPFIYPSNKLFTKHSHCTGSFQMFITYWRVLGTDKTGLTTIEECEDKSAHIANMWRKHVSQSGLCPELGLRQWSMTSGAFDWAEEQTY